MRNDRRVKILANQLAVLVPATVEQCTAVLYLVIDFLSRGYRLEIKRPEDGEDEI